MIMLCRSNTVRADSREKWIARYPVNLPSLVSAMLLSPGSLLQGFCFPQPCNASSSPRALHTFPRKLHHCFIDAHLEVNTRFPVPLSFQDGTVKNNQLKVTHVKCSVCLSLTRNWERCCLYRWAWIYRQLIRWDGHQVSMVGADKGGSWRRRVTLCEHCRKE